MQIEPLKAQSLENKAYLSIKEMIVSLNLSPNETINIKKLADLLQVSITPVRAALQLLERENLVCKVDNKGFYIAPLSIIDVEYVYEMRRSLELLALERSISNIDRGQLISLITEIKKIFNYFNTDNQKLLSYNADYSLHDLIISSCANPYLQKTYYGLMSHIQRYRNLIRQSTLANNEEWIKSELKQHLQIAEFILSGDLKSSQNAMYEHITNLIEIVSSRLAQSGFPLKIKEEQKK